MLWYEKPPDPKLRFSLSVDLFQAPPRSPAAPLICVQNPMQQQQPGECLQLDAAQKAGSHENLNNNNNKKKKKWHHRSWYLQS